MNIWVREEFEMQFTDVTQFTQILHRFNCQMSFSPQAAHQIFLHSKNVRMELKVLTKHDATNARPPHQYALYLS